MQFDEVKTVWMDGELLPWEQANLHVSPRTLCRADTLVCSGLVATRGTEATRVPALHRATCHPERSRGIPSSGGGLFEGIRCYATAKGPAVFRLEEHIARLFASARMHGMEIPYTASELGSAVCQTIAANEFESCRVRPIAFFGSQVAVLAWPWNEGLSRSRTDRYRKWLHFVDDCTFAGAYSALPCI